MQALFDLLKKRNLKITTAESCTGGLVAARITDLPGASNIFERGYISYSNEAKIECLNVSPQIIEAYGAVSAETAAAMAQGALQNSRADFALSITGIAGPDGGTNEKPIGLVFLGIASKNKVETRQHNFTGTRAEIREQILHAALNDLLKLLEEQS